MNLPAKVASAAQYVEWLRVQVHEKAVPSTHKIRASAACFALAQEHHHSIVLLIEHALCGSAFSLLRVGFEAYVRGEWLANCATGKQVGRFLRGQEPPKLDTMLAAIECVPGFEERSLSLLKTKHWRALCGYTHTGGLHVQRWQTSSAIQPNYSQEEISEVLRFAEIIGSVAAIAIAGIAKDDEAAVRILRTFEARPNDG